VNRVTCCSDVVSVRTQRDQLKAGTVAGSADICRKYVILLLAELGPDIVHDPYDVVGAPGLVNVTPERDEIAGIDGDFVVEPRNYWNVNPCLPVELVLPVLRMKQAGQQYSVMPFLSCRT